MDGNEISSITPIITRGSCHHGKRRSPVTIEAMAVPIAPMARPMAANIPANLAASKVFSAGGFPEAVCV